MKDIETFNPLSNSPLPEKVSWLPIENDLPALAPPPLMCSTATDAPPATVTSPANADVATSEPANADKPIFLNLFILITPFYNC